MAARNGKIAFPPRKKEKTLPFQFTSFTSTFFCFNTRHEILGKQIQYLVTVFQT